MTDSLLRLHPVGSFPREFPCSGLLCTPQHPHLPVMPKCPDSMLLYRRHSRRQRSIGKTRQAAAMAAETPTGGRGGGGGGGGSRGPAGGRGGGIGAVHRGRFNTRRWCGIYMLALATYPASGGVGAAADEVGSRAYSTCHQYTLRVL